MGKKKKKQNQRVGHKRILSKSLVLNLVLVFLRQFCLLCFRSSLANLRLLWLKLDEIGRIPAQIHGETDKIGCQSTCLCQSMDNNGFYMFFRATCRSAVCISAARCSSCWNSALMMVCLAQGFSMVQPCCATHSDRGFSSAHDVWNHIPGLLSQSPSYFWITG